MSKSFTELVKLHEAPLQQFNVLPQKDKLPGGSKRHSHMSVDDKIKKDIKSVNTPVFQRKLKQKMKDIPYPIYIYQMNIKADSHAYFSQKEMKLIRDSLNDEYYHRVTPEILAKYYSIDVAKQIKISPSSCTLVYNNQSQFPTSVWGFIHDFVHTITLSENSASKLLDNVEKLINQIIIDASKQIKFDKKNWKAGINIHHRENNIPLLMTVGSARSGLLRKRPEEASTELMTQWIFSKKIEFTWDNISKTEELDAVLDASFDKYVPKIQQLFWEILLNAKGKAYFTS